MKHKDKLLIVTSILSAIEVKLMFCKIVVLKIVVLKIQNGLKTKVFINRFERFTKNQIYVLMTIDF